MFETGKSSTPSACSAEDTNAWFVGDIYRALLADELVLSFPTYFRSFP